MGWGLQFRGLEYVVMNYGVGGLNFFFVYNWFKREGFFFLGGQENYVWDSDSGFKVMEFGDGFFVEIEWSDFFFYLNLDIYLLYLLFF